ncbi:hypothetical protein ABFY64_31395 [Pseudomonas aeruginosa]
MSWRWVFWINLPIGLLALAISRRTLVGLPVPRRQPVIDYLGHRADGGGPHRCSWPSPRSARAQPGATLRCSACSPWRRSPCCCSSPRSGRFREPLVPMQLFAVRAATLSWLVAFFASFQAISLTVLVPLRYQSVTGAGADSAALHLLPLVMGLPLGAYCWRAADPPAWDATSR